MEQKKTANASVLVVSVCLILVVVVLVALFVMSQPNQAQEGIVLPTDQAETVLDPVPEQGGEDDFIQVTTDNVVPMLRSLQRPNYYSQCYEVVVGADAVQASRSVELWVSGELVHAEIYDGRKVKTILTDGTTAWLWYDVDLTPVSVALEGTITAEDLFGLPGFDYLLHLQQNPVVDADYLLLDEAQTQCIYVCAQSGESETERYWINLENGLLYKADALENSQLIYEVKQTYCAMLAAGDEIFYGKFLLPDGTDPFTAAEETPLQ